MKLIRTMTDKWAKKRATILKKYGGVTWAWHFNLNGDLIVRSLTTGLVRNVGKVEQ